MKHPLFPVSGQEPVPCHPPVPSPPEFQSLGSPETTEKETGTVFPMRARPGSMLGKGPGVGRIAVSVVRWVRAVPLGISHSLRRVGGLCAPNGTSAQAYPIPKISKIGRGAGDMHRPAQQLRSLDRGVCSAATSQGSCRCRSPRWDWV